jgi:hypothetical protein
MSALPVQEPAAARPVRLHCPYCGDDFLLSHGTRLEGYGVICPNVKCGSPIRMNIGFPKGTSVSSVNMTEELLHDRVA